MKKIFTILVALLFIQCIKVHAQFGLGTGVAGNATLTGAQTYTQALITSEYYLTPTLRAFYIPSVVGFGYLDQVLIIQVTGTVGSSNVGNWVRGRVVFTCTNCPNYISVQTVLPSTSIPSFDIATEQVLVIKLNEYDNVTIDGTVTPALGENIVAILAKSSISFNTGASIDVSNYGFSHGLGGYSGLPNLTPSVPGVHGSVGNNGGNTGTGGPGVFGGGNGGDQGGIGGSQTPNSPLAYQPSGTSTNAKNGSILSAKRFVCGDGGSGGNGSNASNGGGAGGGGSDWNGLPFGFSGSDGNPGAIGDYGSNGPDGTNGAGMVFLFTNEITSVANNTQINIKANDAGAGGNGGVGGNGGDGGMGAYRDCEFGGGGGGGNGGNGGNGADGASAGAGGVAYAYRNINPPSGVNSPISAYVKNGIALAGAGGQGGAGGAAGLYGADGNTSAGAVLNCGSLGILPCSTANGLQAALTVICDSTGYTGHSNVISATSLPSDFGGYISTYAGGQDSVWFTNFQSLTDCNGNTYNKCDVHVRKGLASFDFNLYSNNGPTSDFLGFLENAHNDAFATNSNGSVGVANALALINDNEIIDNAGTWVHDCYARVCAPSIAQPGLPGQPGIAGLNGDPGVTDEEFFNSTALAINSIILSAQKQNNAANLNWSIANKIELANMQLLKSTDGVTFKEIATILPNAQTGNSYSYIDALSDEDFNHTVYYKINATSNDNIETMSNTASIICYTTNSLSIYPNPIKTHFTISSNYNISQVDLYNTNGQIVQSWTNEKTHIYQLNNITKGVYYIKAKSSNNMYMQKIVVE
jgi:hypothetical protein